MCDCLVQSPCIWRKPTMLVNDTRQKNSPIILTLTHSSFKNWKLKMIPLETKFIYIHNPLFTLLCDMRIRHALSSLIKVTAASRNSRHYRQKCQALRERPPEPCVWESLPTKRLVPHPSPIEHTDMGQDVQGWRFKVRLWEEGDEILAVFVAVQP